MATENDSKPHASMVKATEVFLSLRKPGAGKLLFETENKEAIRTLMNDRLNAASQGTTADASKAAKKLNPAAEYQNAWSQLWASADQESFNERAQTKDIFEWV